VIARFRLLVNEAVRSVWANLSTTVAATMTVLIGMVLLGLFIGLGTWVLSYSDHIKKELLVKVFFCAPSDDVRVCPKGQRETADSVNAVTAKLQALQASGEVKRYTFVSKDEALRRFRKDNPDLAQPLTSNPFPDGFEVVPNKPENIASVAANFHHGEDQIQLVNYGKKYSDRVLKVTSVVETVFLIAVLVLLASSTMLIANTIRLSIFSRRREIEVMKLVGATNWFIRGPFMIEGLLVGLGGSLVAVLLLLFAKVTVVGSLPDALSAPGVHAMSFWLNGLILLAVGLVLGAGGAGLTLRKFLQV
jgi:cell division transport system permease protein